MQSFESLASVREIITASCSRYATITASGIILPGSHTPQNPLRLTLSTYKPARTRYVNKQPVCRSLNGLASLQDNIRCITCDYRRTCTPQIALEAIYHAIPLRFMLAYTSAKNFMAFLRAMPAGRRIEGAIVDISILDRGKWGEARFALCT